MSGSQPAGSVRESHKAHLWVGLESSLTLSEKKPQCLLLGEKCYFVCSFGFSLQI